MTKELLPGYVGVKYTAVCLADRMPACCAEAYGLFRSCGDLLCRHGMTPANGGNLSQRRGQGLVITTSGCNLGCIEKDELALVHLCSLQEERVTYEGLRPPSSEAMLHWLIYQDFPGAGSVVHAHDELATSSAAAGRLPHTPREEPYGTAALARLAGSTFLRGEKIIVLKNHGYVARGEDLQQATRTVVQMHLLLLSAAGGS